MAVILILIWFTRSFSALILILISGFAKNANLSNGIFKDQTRVHPRARTVRRNGHKCHAAFPSLEKLKK